MAKKETKHKRESAIVRNIRGLLDGSILTRDVVLRQLPYIFFLALLALIYIANTYHAEKVYLQTERVQERLDELRSERIFLQSELVKKGRQRDLEDELEKKDSDLELSDEPPRKVFYDFDK